MTHHLTLFLKLISIVAVTLIIAGCVNQHQLAKDLNRFQQRVASVLNTQSPEQASLPLLRYPDPKSLTVSLEQINIRLTEFYALQDCPVTTLIAKRNTALGKIQLPSQRYVYEVALIEGLKDCISRQNQQAQTLPLQKWLMVKQQQLPLVWADLLQNSSEMKATLSANDGYILGSDKDNFAAYYQAIRYVVNLKQSPSADTQKLETHLQTLAQTPLIARMAATQALLSQRLNETSQWLASHATALSCELPSKQQQVARLENVFNHYFVSQIQGVAGNLNNYYYKLSPLLEVLRQSDPLTPEFKALIIEFHLSFTQYQHAMAKHIKIWQSIFKTCP